MFIAVINFGKSLDYKLDNTFITMGVLYLILTGSDLTTSKNSYCLYSWLYGFSWSLGLEMFSNPRIITANRNFFDDNFLQNSHSNAHLLLFVDDNLVRNCWSIFLLLFAILALTALVWGTTQLLTKNYFSTGEKSQTQPQI